MDIEPLFPGMPFAAPYAPNRSEPTRSSSALLAESSRALRNTAQALRRHAQLTAALR